MAEVRSIFKRFLLYLYLLLFHLGCFIITTESPPTKKRKISPTPPSTPPSTKSHKSFSFFTPWPYLKRLFLFKKKKTPKRSSSQHSLISVSSGSCRELNITLDRSTFAHRNDIFPCPTCGEIFNKTPLLDHHQSTKHAISELFEGDSGHNIVRIIFKTGWDDKYKSPTIHKILKVHNSPKILSRFEEYREAVKSKAAKNPSRRNERCIVDGNELLRFHCSTFICPLGHNGNYSICNHQFCSVCGIIRYGFSPKLDGIPTLSNSRRAHVSIPEDLEEEFGFMNVKRAMLVCRVVAGRVARDPGGVVEKDDPGFDSVVGGGGARDSLEEELLVFNPRAVLPCFVIVYSVRG